MVPDQFRCGNRADQIKAMLAVSILSLMTTPVWAAPVIVNFETVPVIATQPSNFADTSPYSVTVPGIATFSGGTVLGNESNLPAQSFATAPNVYATAAFTSGYDPLLTITIDPSFTVTEISFPGFNGESAQSYTANAYNGSVLVATETLFLASNGNSGFGVFDLVSPLGITSVTFGQTVQGQFWDFSIDTVDFNGNIMATVPLPAAAPMFGATLLAFGAVGYGLKRRKAATT